MREGFKLAICPFFCENGLFHNWNSSPRRIARQIRCCKGDQHFWEGLNLHHHRLSPTFPQYRCHDLPSALRRSGAEISAFNASAWM
jgi:hypothetical protein